MATFNQEILNDATKYLATAEKLWEDFTGQMERGLGVTQYGDFVVVDDGQDRWIGLFDEYQSALDVIAKKALAGRYEKERIHDAYGDLCYECPALYSRIGSGKFNEDVAGLVQALDESVTREGIEEILEYLGIDLDELCTVEAE